MARERGLHESKEEAVLSSSHPGEEKRAPRRPASARPGISACFHFFADPRSAVECRHFAKIPEEREIEIVPPWLSNAFLPPSVLRSWLSSKPRKRGGDSTRARWDDKVWFNDIDLRLRWQLSLLKTLRLERYREPGGWKRGWIRIWSALRGYFVRFERTIGIRERGKLG